MKLSRLRIYTKQAKMMFQDVMIYRADFISRNIAFSVRFFIAIFLWLAILNSKGGNIAGFDVPTILTYFLFMQIVSGFVFTHGGFRVASDIQMGDLSSNLIQPVDYLMLMFSREYGKTLFFFIANVALYLLIGFLFQDYFNFDLRIEFIVLGVITMHLASLMNYCLTMMVGMLAFWITSSQRLIFTYFAIINLIGGILVPLEFFPKTIQTILLYSPFPYTFYFPVHILQSTVWTAELEFGLAMMLFYSVVLTALMYGMYWLGLRKYEAVGR